MKTTGLETTVFMQDAVSSYIARPVTALFRSHFTLKREISRDFPIAWPPRSANLNPLIFDCGDF